MTKDGTKEPFLAQSDIWVISDARDILIFPILLLNMEEKFTPMKRNMSRFLLWNVSQSSDFKTWLYYCSPSTEVERKIWIFPPIWLKSERSSTNFFRLRRLNGQPLQMPIILLLWNLLPGKETCVIPFFLVKLSQTERYF